MFKDQNPSLFLLVINNYIPLIEIKNLIKYLLSQIANNYHKIR